MHHMDHPEDQVKAWFVHDYKGEHWIRGETAYFVKSDRLKTPMGGGVAAFENKAAAEAFAAGMSGKIYTLDELRVAIHEAVHG
jgi:copper chaperone NosL